MIYYKQLLLSSCVILSLTYSHAQSDVTVMWEDALTSTASESHGMVIDQSDRIYIYTSGPCRLIRYTTDGDTIWSRTPDYQVMGMDIDNNGDVLTIGRIYTSGVGYAWKINKWDSTGAILWVHIVGTSLTYQPYHIECDAYNNIYATGNLNNQFGVVKIYPNGVEAWSYSLPGIAGSNNKGHDISVKDTNAFYVVGKQDYNMQLIKFNSLGDTLWTRWFRRNVWLSNATTSDDQGTYVEADDSGNVYVQNKTLFPSGKSQTMKFDSTGNFLWCYEHSPLNSSLPVGVFIDSTGNILSAGSDNGGAFITQAYIEKRTPGGNSVWENYYTLPSDGVMMAGAELDADNIYLHGRTNECNGCQEAMVIFKVMGDGTLDWYYKANIGAHQNVDVNDMVIDSDKIPYGTGAIDDPVYIQQATTFKLFECDRIDPDFTFLNDTLWANTTEYMYRWLDCNDNFSSLTGLGNLNNYYVPSNLGSFTLLTEYGTCADTADCLITGYETLAGAFLTCPGDDFTFPDGSTVYDVQQDTTQTSYLIASDGLDSLVTSTVLIYNDMDMTVDVTSTTLTSNAWSWSVDYQWVDCLDNYNTIIGETNDTFSPDSSGLYAAVIDNGSCVDTTGCYIVDIVLIEELTSSNYYIYPNPIHTNGLIHVSGLESGYFRIINSCGQNVMEDEFHKSIQLENLASGYYTVELVADEKVIRSKLVVE